MRRCHNALELTKDFRESKRMFHLSRFHLLLILNLISDIIRMQHMFDSNKYTVQLKV